MEKQSIVNSMKAYWKGLGRNQWLLVLLVGILLMVIVLPVEKKEEKKKETTTQKTESSKGQWEEYKEEVEVELEDILAQMQGVGRVEVMVTFEGTEELVVEKDNPQTQSNVQEEDSSGGTRTTKESSWEESTVYTQQDGSSEPYVIKELAPKLEGVLVIAEGGNNAVVAKNISEAVQALFPIEVHKIKVVKMK